MNNDTTLVLTQKLLDQHFKDMCDPVLHSPYKVGDILRCCGTCGAIIRKETISSTACPANPHHTFVPVPVISRSEETIVIHHNPQTHPIRNTTQRNTTQRNTTQRTTPGVEQRAQRRQRFFQVVVLLLAIICIAITIYQNRTFISLKGNEFSLFSVAHDGIRGTGNLDLLLAYLRDPFDKVKHSLDTIFFNLESLPIEEWFKW